jgi:hypothetical protein
MKPQEILTNRFEFKYWLSRRQKEQLVSYIMNFMKPDQHNEGSDGYHIQSLYFDTHDLRSYYEKYDGNYFRRKYRVRFYGHDTSKAFFEIKEKRNIFVRKLRGNAELPTGDLQPIFDLPPSSPSDVDFFVSCIKQQDRAPTCWVAYRRIAFFGINTPSLRLTMDHELMGAPATNFYFPNARFQPVFFGNWDTPIILEIKFDRYMPTWLEKALIDLRLEVQSISKYGMVINKDRFYNRMDKRWMS